MVNRIIGDPVLFYNTEHTAHKKVYFLQYDNFKVGKLIQN